MQIGTVKIMIMVTRLTEVLKELSYENLILIQGLGGRGGYRMKYWKTIEKKKSFKGRPE